MVEQTLLWFVLLPVMGVAAFSVLAVWFRGDIFLYMRDRAESARDLDPGEPFAGIRRWFGELFSCPFCLSYHVSFWVAVYATAVGWAPVPLFLFSWWVTQVLAYFLYRLSDDTPVDPPPY